uniref:ribosomal protein L14 n=1 Tax=Odontella aurita TaxID=265563 RepID=UPI002028938F|nr:ribosomal protein L14 [Odontella aurita]QYB22951.1 ribosomal protein L14 [Odontella aurita]
MIQQQTKLKVSDNSGAKIVKCIKTLGGFKKKYNKINETVIVSVQHLRNKAKLSSKVRKGEIYKAVIVKSKKKLQKKDGSTFKNHENSVILLTKQNKPLATRIVGPITKELKIKKFSKLKNISTGIL